MLTERRRATSENFHFLAIGRQGIAFCCPIGVALATMPAGGVRGRDARARADVRLQPTVARRRTVLPAATSSSAPTGCSRVMTNA
jgi:hypothetical protein